MDSPGLQKTFGNYDDPPDKETICGLGNRKNKDFQKVLRREGPDVFGSTMAFIKECKRRGIKIGVASSSQNCKLILELGKIEKYFETRVCGIVSRKLKLKGKPDPDIFVTAAERLTCSTHAEAIEREIRPILLKLIGGLKRLEDAYTYMNIHANMINVFYLHLD